MSGKQSQYDLAATRRQMILDFLHRAPGAMMGEIVAWLARRGDTGNAANTMRTMAEWGELRYTGQTRFRRYYPLVKKTRSASESIEIRQENLAAANARRKKEAPAPATAPGHYIHKPGERPIPNQGGQGASRPRTFVNCGGNYAH